jgi:hypothetical protein
MVEVDGIKTHALLDTGAGSSYASSSLTSLINALKRKPKAVKTKRIKMMLGSTTTTTFASAKESGSRPSLNDCPHPGPPLQNLLWDVLVRSRFHPILLTGDLKQAFLQIRIKAEDRDSLRFHWKETGNDAIQIYRFTRALFGLTCSPFLFGGVLLNTIWVLGKIAIGYPEIAKQLREGLYVDDLITVHSEL